MREGKAIFRWICILGGAMLVLLLVLAGGYYWISGRPLARRLAELRAAGEPTCLADLEKPVPANNNGALYLLEAKAEVEAAEKEIFAVEDSAEGKPSREGKEKIHKILESHPTIMPLLRKAATATEFRFPFDYHVKPSQFISTILPLMQFKRECMRYLKSQADDLLNQGKRAEALETDLLMLQLARQYDRDCPILVNNLVDIACKGIAMSSANEILQSGPVEERQRAALEAELAKNDSLETCRAAIKGERAYCLDALQNEMPPIINGQWQLAALEMFDDFFKCSKEPYSTGVGKMKPPSGTSFSLRSGPISLSLPALKAFLEASFRNQAMVRSLRIINALQRKALAEGDKIPSMEELGLPKETGVDPFNGQAMIVKKTPEGWLVYSVGQNLQDDGGKLGDRLDAGFGPQKYMAEEEEKEADAKKTTE